MSDFSSNLRRLRKRSGLSQEALAGRLAVTRQTVSSWERGNSYPDLELLTRISDVLQTSPNDLLYPPAKKRASVGNPSPRSFRTVAVILFVAGLLLGISAASQSYASSPDTVSWHFVLSDALPYWVAAFLSGMVFIGFEQVLLLLQDIRWGESN
ncbi:helix-turn-helix domain-containing protein [Oscillibacter sp. MSJ-2]|uniref:Helix-turn-helix domain-containing protein n=1 Tax=Dysosmobacter acutus TaxID=2841504 RepID=A0ABS6FCC5_9FIRM|nr:helix-turn-helix transcriptional regulator [Dysosmobacter acutus]MBU5626994.1 helix-turn-helix domain-containing protein [Dysosmobacter acutus]